MDNWPEFQSEITPQRKKLSIWFILNWVFSLPYLILEWVWKKLSPIMASALKQIWAYASGVVGRIIEKALTAVLIWALKLALIVVTVMFLTAFIANDFSISRTFSTEGISIIYQTYK